MDHREQPELFELIEESQPRRLWSCPLHAQVLRATDDGARVAGWSHYRGLSQTGKEIDSVLCPICRKGQTTP